MSNPHIRFWRPSREQLLRDNDGNDGNVDACINSFAHLINNEVPHLPHIQLVSSDFQSALYKVLTSNPEEENHLLDQLRTLYGGVESEMYLIEANKLPNAADSIKKIQSYDLPIYNVNLTVNNTEFLVDVEMRAQAEVLDITVHNLEEDEFGRETRCSFTLYSTGEVHLDINDLCSFDSEVPASLTPFGIPNIDALDSILQSIQTRNQTRS